jgi:hypothetical protein
MHVYEEYGNDYDWSALSLLLSLCRSCFICCFFLYFPEPIRFMKADDDTYVVVENLRTFLSKHNPEDPHYFGWTVASVAVLLLFKGTSFDISGRRRGIRREAADMCSAAPPFIRWCYIFHSSCSSSPTTGRESTEVVRCHLVQL